ncbi:AAA family ATPase [Candidatus Saccharibacteria bacterium]|nr:AAA family ATPase [Candidatus Saccharibacteria bacterium]
MDIRKIVITGGPCGGKTTALSWVVENFTKMGWKVLTVEEAATQIIMRPLRPNVDLTVMGFQDLIMKTQIFLEDSTEHAIKDNKTTLYGKDDKVLIVCDRGICDGAAYVARDEYNELLARNNLSIQEAFDRYDAVFHLVTAADGAPKYYSLVGNKARSESKEEAIATDKRTQDAWVGHPRLRIIDNNGLTFRRKLKKLMAEIAQELGEPRPLEERRRYLIKVPEEEVALKGFRKVEIMQTYLPSEGDKEIYVRQRGINGKFSYTKTVCYDASKPGSSIELESRIEHDEYAKHLIAADSRMAQIRKNRYCYVDPDRHYLKIDYFFGVPGYALLEIELRNVNEEVVLPGWARVVCEVTNDPRFSNYEISRTGGKIPTKV